jgi:hypothetical protein
MEIVTVHGHINDVMKRALTILLALALPLAADEVQPAKTATGAAAEAQAVEPDSPLVAAAKRANRRGRKSTHVITNETLKTVGANAHVTTTTEQRSLQMPKPLDPPRPTPEMAVAKAQEIQKKQLEQIASEKKKQDDARRAAAAAAAEASEEGMYELEDADPAQSERAEQEANQPKPPQF